MGHAREKNVGWRIDYFIVSKSIENKIKEAKIHDEILGSDHCPVELEIDLKYGRRKYGGNKTRMEKKNIMVVNCNSSSNSI